MSSDINIGDFLTTRAYLNPDKEVLYDTSADKRLSYDELNRRANKISNALQSMGIEKGDRIGILAYNGHEFIESFFGPAKSGLVIVPLNWRLTAEELSFILNDSGVKAIIFDTDFSAIVEQIKVKVSGDGFIEHWVEIGEQRTAFAQAYEDVLAKHSDAEPNNKASADDNLFIMYTSGTTGFPKGVVHTHATEFWAILTLTNTADMRFSDRYLVLLPLFHVGALTPVIGGVYSGNSLVVQRNFDPQETWALIDREKISTSLAVPSMLNFMLQVQEFEKYNWSSLRWVMSSAAPLPVVTINAYKNLGIEIHQAYGLTETCGAVCLIGPEDAMRKIGSTGKSFFHTKIRIVDEKGRDLPAGTAGEVVVSCGHLMKEYWNRPEATQAIMNDGWLSTGDIAICDEQGFVTIQDRIKDMIISGGENIYPAEIENVLLQHPSVVDTAVIGQASDKWGEVPLAIILKNDEALTKESLLAHCDGKLARFKLPKNVVFVSSIPRNPSGKILKRILREQHAGDCLK